MYVRPEDDVPEVLLCKICFARKIDTVLLPCRHRVACRLCISEMARRNGGRRVCPIDRSEILQVIETIDA